MLVPVAAALAWLSASLPSQAFFSGDSGLKLIAAREAIAHPRAPFQVSLPTVGGRPATAVDPMVLVHGDHGHVVQSPLFPVLSAPAIAAFGLRGAYVLPACAFIALLPLLFVILPRRDRPGPESRLLLLVAGGIAIGANPLFFYSLEFWEHAPAVCLLAASTAVAVGHPRSSRASLDVLSGLLGGLSILLRPEAFWYIAGLGVTCEWRRWPQFGLGVALAVAPFGIANAVHSGSALGPHAATTLAPLTTDFIDARWARVRAWLWPHSIAEWTAVALLAVAGLGGRVTRDVAARQAIGLAGAAIIAILAAGRLLPRESFWQAFPVASLALLPVLATDPWTRRLRFMAGFTFLGVVLTATHDGGAQWGTRFLLVTAPALLVLAVSGAAEALRSGRYRAVRAGLVAVVLVAGLATSRAAYLELRGAKRAYAGLVSFTASTVPAGATIVTNIWWFDQMMASLHHTRRFLYAPDPGTATQALRTLAASGVRDAALAWTAEETGTPLTDAAADTCFRVNRLRRAAIRDVHIAVMTCGPDAAGRAATPEPIVLGRNAGGAHAR